MTYQEITSAVDDGQKVYVGNLAYIVIKSKFGEYMIKCTLNNHFVGLGKPDRMNGEISLWSPCWKIKKWVDIIIIAIAPNVEPKWLAATLTAMNA